MTLLSGEGDDQTEARETIARAPATLPHPRRVRRHGEIVTTVEQRDGRTVLVKRAQDDEARAAVAHEGRMLALARHPGVAELLALTDEPDGAELVQAFVSSHSLATTRCRSAAHAAGIVAALAETVADLHHLGIVHGRLGAEHVVLNPEGHPILVGWREGRAGVPPATVAVDERTAPERHARDELDRRDDAVDDDERVARHRHDDVAALGRLLRALVLEHPDHSPIVPERRWRRARSDAQDRRALLTLADHATADTPAARPGARRFAAAILTAVPDATLVHPGDGLPRRDGAGPAVLHAPGPEADHADPAADPDGGPEEELRAPARRGARGQPERDAGRAGGGLDHAVDRHETGPYDGPVTRGHRRRGVPYAAGLVGLTLLVVGALSLQHGPRPSLGTEPIEGGAPEIRADTARAPEQPAAAVATSTPGVATGPRPATATTPPSGATGDEAGPVASSPARPPSSVPPTSAAAPDGTPPPAGHADRGAGAAPAPLQFQAAGIVHHAGHRYTIGAPGDELAVGALTCGAREPDRVAVLRPATGEVFVFDGWAAPDAPQAAPVVTRVPPGSRWSVPAGSTCVPLAVLHGDGTSTAVTLPPKGSP